MHLEMMFIDFPINKGVIFKLSKLNTDGLLFRASRIGMTLKNLQEQGQVNILGETSFQKEANI